MCLELKLASEREGEREMDGWMDGLLYNQWIDYNNTVGERSERQRDRDRENPWEGERESERVGLGESPSSHEAPS